MKLSQDQNEIVSEAVREAINKIFEWEDVQKVITALVNAPDYTHNERVRFAILKFALQTKNNTKTGLVSRFFTAFGSAKPSVMDGFKQGLRIASEDWRDILLKVGLEGENWAQVLLSDGLVDQKWLEEFDTDDSGSSRASSFFRMKVNDVYTIRGRGISVVGKVESGILNVRDEIHIMGKDSPQKLVVAGILLEHKQVDQVSSGANIEIQLLDVEKDCVKRGQDENNPK